MAMGAEVNHGVAQFYDVPTLTLRNALAPFFARDKKPILEWFHNEVPDPNPETLEGVDIRHLSGKGHELAANMMIAYLELQLCEMDRLERDTRGWSADKLYPAEPIFPNLLMTKYDPWHPAARLKPTCITTSSDKFPLVPKHQSGWREWAWKDKKYLVADAPGSTIEFDFSVSRGTVFLYFLRSNQFGLGTLECEVVGVDGTKKKIPAAWDLPYNIGRSDRWDSLPPGEHTLKCEVRVCDCVVVLTFPAAEGDRRPQRRDRVPPHGPHEHLDGVGVGVERYRVAMPPTTYLYTTNAQSSLCSEAGEPGWRVLERSHAYYSPQYPKPPLQRQQRLLRAVNDNLDDGLAVGILARLGELERVERVLKLVPVRDEGLEVDEAALHEAQRSLVVALAVAERADDLELLGDDDEHGDRDGGWAHADLDKRARGAEGVQPCADAHWCAGRVDDEVDRAGARGGHLELGAEGGGEALRVGLVVLAFVLGRLRASVGCLQSSVQLTGRKTSLAAYSFAKSSRSFWMSTAMTRRAPRALAVAMQRRPTGPAPKMRTVSLPRIPPRLYRA